MIEDMALLKRTMQQMDAEDPVAAQAAKDRAAEILGKAKLNFSKMAEWIEQRRLLLRPTIVARIKRMDQPGILGDSAFRDTGSALRKEGQSFLQIAEAIEAAGQPAPRYAETVPESAPAPAHVTEGEPFDPTAVDPGTWLTTLILIGGFVTFPFRHPLRFLVVVLFAVVLFYAYRGVATLGHEVTGYFDGSGVAAVRQRADAAISSVSSFVREEILRQGKETAAPPAPTPSPAAAATSPSPTPSPSPSASELAPPAVTPATPPTEAAGPPAAAPRRDARTPPSARAAANCDRFTASGRCASADDGRARAFEPVTPEGFRRNSRLAGPCRHGVGGCNWGGGQY